jgi:hypothetical protein
VNLVTETELDETVAILKGVLAGAPHGYDLMFMLAQLYLRKQDFSASRQLIAKVIENGDADLSQRSKRLLAQLVSVEAQLERMNQQNEVATNSHSGISAASDVNNPAAAAVIERPYDAAAVLRESLRRPATGETQMQGMLTRIDCDAKGITFVIKVNGRALRLNSDSFLHAHMISFSADAGRDITCGIRKRENNVIVAYVPRLDTRSRIDGEIKSLEFVPADFTLKP